MKIALSLAAIALSLPLVSCGSYWTSVTKDFTSGKIGCSPDACSERVPQCLDQGKVTLESKWQWSAGQSIRLVLGRIEGAVGIGVVYRGGTQETEPKTDGL